MDNVIITPHAAFYTDKATWDMVTMAYDSVNMFEKNEVNKYKI